MYSCRDSLVPKISKNGISHILPRFWNLEDLFEQGWPHFNMVFYFWPIEQLGYLIRNGHSDKHSTPQQFTRPINFFFV